MPNTVTKKNYDYGDVVPAIFEPKRKDDLREGMIPLIGKTFKWEFIGVSDDDEPYAGQSRWWISREHDADIPDECRGRWLPREDIRIL